MAFGDNIQKLRNSKGMSQQELADAIGIGRSTLANYEQNKREPNYKTLEAIAKYFNVSIDYILGLTNDKFDYTHKDTLSEIIYKQIYKLTDVQDYHGFTEDNLKFLKLIKEGTFIINEEIMNLIAKVYDTNTSYLLGLTSMYYSFDPMETGNILDKEKINELIQKPEEIIEKKHTIKRKNYEALITNKAFNTLMDLGIEKINGKYIKTIDSKSLSDYYSAIIEYIKNTIRLVDFDKVIEEYESTSKNKTNFNKKNTNFYDYYHDFFVAHATNNIEDVKNGYQFEKYIAYLLTINDYDVQSQTTIDTDKYSDKRIDMIASKENKKFYIECKFYKNKYNYDELKHLIKKYLDYYNFNKNSLKNNNKKYESNFVIVTNLEDFPVSDDMELKIWDKKYINKLEKKAK